MPARTPAVTTQRGYTFLLERLLPRHLLTAEREARLQRAFSSGDRALLHSESVAALRDLEALGLYEELPATVPGRSVFRSTATCDRIHLMQPAEARQQASRPTPQTVSQSRTTPQEGVGPPPETPVQRGDATQNRSAATALQETQTAIEPADATMAAAPREVGPAPPPSAPQSPAAAILERGAEAPGQKPLEPEPGAGEKPPAQPPALPAVEPASLEQLEPLLSVIGIEEKLSNLAERLRVILERVSTLLPDARVRIWHLEGRTSEELGDGPLQLLKRTELDATPHLREALRLDRIQYATTAPVGSSPNQGDVAVAVPLRVGDLAWGLLEVTWVHGSVQRARAFAPLLTPLARLVELGIQNQTTMEKLVFVDPLTGVYNRAFYERQLTLEMERAHRTNRKFGLLVMDLDNFKSINDRFGHRAGDQVLARIAHEVRARMRKIDLIFRYGGEEFVLILPGAQQLDARRTAERLRTVVSETRFEIEGVAAPVQVTVSVGVAVYPDDARTRSGIFKHADAALYRAKEQGKNRVVFQ
ncbi:MAG: GGDEF domain-containing protein [Candidatus Latescibacterota bacterium]|nr:MAG: GGDEF domain-containing protein [Candidatus Latescibacterota bacterium]